MITASDGEEKKRKEIFFQSYTLHSFLLCCHIFLKTRISMGKYDIEELNPAKQNFPGFIFAIVFTTFFILFCL